MFRRALCILLLAICALLHFTTAGLADDAAAVFESAPVNITIRIPSGLQQVAASGPVAGQALLLLRAQTGDFPTANLIRVPGVLPPEGAVESVLQSYRSIGLTDVRPIGPAGVSPQGWPIVRLQYRDQSGTLFEARILLIPRHDSYLVLTFLDPTDKMPGDAPLFDQLVASTHEINPSQQQPAAKRSVLPAVLLALVVCVLIGKFVTAARKRKVAS